MLKSILVGSGIAVVVKVIHECYIPLMKDVTTRPYRLAVVMAIRKVFALVTRVSEFLRIRRGYIVKRAIDNWLAAPIRSTAYMKIRAECLDGVRALVYEPMSSESECSMPAVIYIHGGGWAHSSPETYHFITNELARSLNYVVISIDYRLAPEHPYPIPFEDCLKATTFFLRNASSYGVDPHRVAIAGDSAGGNLAAAVSLKLHSDPSLPKLKLQVLLYPALQAVNFNTDAYRDNAHDYVVSGRYMVKFWLLYLRGEAAFTNVDLLLDQLQQNCHLDTSAVQECLDRVHHPKGTDKSGPSFGPPHPDLAPHFTQAVQDPYFSPLTGASDESLRRLPPVYLVTCKRDVLRDDGLMYKSRLEEVGVRVYHQEYDFLHGIYSFGRYEIPEGLAALCELADFLKNTENL